MGLVFYGALAAAAVVWRVGFYHEPIFLLAAPTQPPVEIFWVRDAVLGAAVAGILIGISDWMTRKTRWGEDLARAMAQALGRLSIPNAVLLAVASGTAEELFFRGALQPRAGLILSSLLFGCVHFVPRREFLPWTGFAIVAGFLFGGLFVWTGNLLAPIVAHIVVNAVNLPMLVRRYGPSSPEAGEPEGPDASL
jgi:membrane protease YdiL (CAAX protease family)